MEDLVIKSIKNNSAIKCRFCNSEIRHLFISLGDSPLSNSYLTQQQLQKTEPFYPLDVYICDKCLLVQLQEFESPANIFSDYAYFSSYSDSWLKHCKEYVDKMINLFRLNSKTQVIEIASNDGYLLQYFLERSIPVLGIEPAGNVAKVAIEKGIPTETIFFGAKTAETLVSQGKQADLLLGNNVLAHVPNINDFIQGMKIILKSDGIITMEFPHIKSLIEGNQFDTIYHEHFSYFSFLAVEKIFAVHRLTVFDVEKINTHGGSLRIYVKHDSDHSKDMLEGVDLLREEETNSGYGNIDFYLNFQEKVKAIKVDICNFLKEIKKEGKTIVGYGAPAKGNTLLNYCQLNSDLIDYTVDKNPYKQGCYLPGSRISIEHPSKISETKPDYVLILPWNIKEEIIEQLSFIREWDGKFIILIPKIEVI